MKYFFVASLLCGVQQASSRTNAGGACTDITDKAKCCTMYDARLSTAAASNCVPALDTFTNGAKCEAEAMVIERGECALVGLCQDHVQVASAACLNTVVDQVTVKGVMWVPKKKKTIYYFNIFFKLHPDKLLIEYSYIYSHTAIVSLLKAWPLD